MAATRKTARIVEARMLSPSVRSVRLAPAEAALGFEAGQWIDLYVSTPEGVQKRAYSIASPSWDPVLELAITLVADGATSPTLHALSAGMEVEIEGPYGFFTRDAELRPEPTLFVATGTGLSPLRSMLFDWQSQAERPPATLLFGVRSQRDILWREQLEAWARDYPDLSLEVTLSRPDPGWTGRRGYVQTHVVELARAVEARGSAREQRVEARGSARERRVERTNAASHVFICGLNRMVSDVRALCKGALGYERKRIHSERYD